MEKSLKGELKKVKITFKNLNIDFALYALIIGLFMAFSQTAQAATITVNSLADTQANDTFCTLREAIINANADNQTGTAPTARRAQARTRLRSPLPETSFCSRHCRI